jgi:hypothetical protein
MKPIYAVCPTPEDGGRMAALFARLQGEYHLVTSLTETSQEAARAVITGQRLQAAHAYAESFLARPGRIEDAEIVMSRAPQDLQGWMLRNFLWQWCCSGFIYLATPETLSVPDLTINLTLAREHGHSTIAILPVDQRDHLPPINLTLTTVCVGEAEVSTIGRLFETLFAWQTQSQIESRN